MTHALDRRLTRLEEDQPQPDGPYAIMPERCNTMQEWLARYGHGMAEGQGKGHYEMLPFAPGAYVRCQRWVAD